MADPAYDGLCGIPSRFTLRDGTHLRCRYELGHAGDHEWEKHADAFRIFGGIQRSDALRRAKHGNVAARAILRIPLDCTCNPLYSADGERVDYLFVPDCKAHAKNPGT